MICPFCKELLPDQLSEAHYCVYCGRPVAQVCPYEDEQDGTLVALIAANGKAPTSCSHCQNLFRACHVCFRLHRLDDIECNTKGCTYKGSRTLLREPSNAFSSPLGSLDGSHTVHWGALPKGQPQVVAQDGEGFYSLLYRYGMLIGLSPQDLVVLSWDGRWNVQSRAPLGMVNSNSTMIVDNGNAYIALPTRVCVARLGTQVSLTPRQWSETCLRQVKSHGKWVRLCDNGSGNALLKIVDCQSWEEREVALSLPNAAIRDMAVDTDQAVWIAAGEQGLHRLDFGTFSLEQMRGPLDQTNCVRVAVTSSGIVVLALPRQGAGTLALLSLGNQPELLGHYQLTGSYLEDFACDGHQVYLVQNTAIQRFALEALSQHPQTVPLRQGGAEVDPGFMLLSNEDASQQAMLTHHLLMRRVTGGGKFIQPCLVSPDTAAQQNIGYDVGPNPIWCVADQRIVIATMEHNVQKLRTYEWGGV